MHTRHTPTHKHTHLSTDCKSKALFFSLIDHKFWELLLWSGLFYGGRKRVHAVKRLLRVCACDVDVQVCVCGWVFF